MAHLPTMLGRDLHHRRAGQRQDDDVDQLGGRRDPGRLRRFFKAYALNTAGVVPLSTVHGAAEIDRKTAEAYEGLLRDLFVIDTVPAWSSNGDLFGRLLDTFVFAQLRGELQVGFPQPRLYHLRDRNGDHEVDLIAELDAHRIVAIEVKATAAPRLDSARHLVWLRDRLGERFVAGVVLHTGLRVLELGERIIAAPVAALWS